MGILSGQQAKGLHAALLDGYDFGSLRQLVRFELDAKLRNITGGGNFSDTVFDLIDWAEQEDRTRELFEAAQRENAGNRAIKSWVAAFEGSIQKGVGHSTLEKIVDKNQKFKSARRWRDRLGDIERQVCRIERDGVARGTGFLVAPDLLLTNHHVVSKVISGSAQPSSLAARFDFQLALDVDVPEKGKLYTLHDDWLVDSSPHDPVDTKPREERDYEPDRNHLDYAFLRLAEAAGEEQLEEGKRDFVRLPEDPPELEVDGAVFIVQHPGGDVLKLALNTKSITEVNAGQTRVRHRTNTKGGSSGSPSFDSDWKLIALHHSGDPDKIKPEYNEGIPIQTIRETLKPEVRDQVGWV